MTQASVTLRDLFVRVFGFTDLAEVDEAIYGHVVGWDSVGHIQLVEQIEDTFGILLETEDIIDMASFRHTCEILQKYGVDAVP